LRGKYVVGSGHDRPLLHDLQRLELRGRQLHDFLQRYG
jgi:hypothetical protein